MSYSRTKLNNKSRPEKAYVVDTKHLHKRRKKHTATNETSTSRKRSPLSPQNKYVPGDFIYDTKGQKAEIKYIGQCHKGPGTWYGIEFVDGSLGKHDGTIDGQTYFSGTSKRCDMIRIGKIRRKTFMQRTTQRYPTTRRIRKRATSDISHMKSLSVTDLSTVFQKKGAQRKKRKRTHKRMNSQPSQICNLSPTQLQSVNDLYFDARKQDRNVFLFGNKSREERVVNGSYADMCAGYKGKASKKQRYKGNKYILARDKETEKRKHDRVGLIKTCKKRVKKQKHERNTSKIQQILKRKELKKEEISRLMEQNKMKELERIKAAKQKSKRKLNKPRSNAKNDVKYDAYETNRNNTVNTMVDTHCPMDGTLNTNAFDVEKVQRPATQSVLLARNSDYVPPMPSKPPSFAMDSMFPTASSDSALLLEEMLHQPMSELVSSEDECASEDSLIIAELDDASEKAISLEPTSDCTNHMIELPKPKAAQKQMRFSEIYVPMCNGYESQSKSNSLPPHIPTLKRAESAPIIVNDDKGTDYWIKQYNRSNKKRKFKVKKKNKSPLKKAVSKPKLSIINPKCCAKVVSPPSDASSPPDDSNHSPFICDNLSDIASLCSSNPSFDSLTSSPPQYSRSAGSTPIGNMFEPNESPSNDFNNCTENNNNGNNNNNTVSAQSKHGGYPFVRKRQAYINKRFTGMVRIGHRYLLRDGRIGVVRYSDATQFGVGTWIGIELDKAEGEHNGSVNNVKYFECDALYGTFVKKSQIAQYIGRDTTKSLSTQQLRCLNIVT